MWIFSKKFCVSKKHLHWDIEKNKVDVKWKKRGGRRQGETEEKMIKILMSYDMEIPIALKAKDML